MTSLYRLAIALSLSVPLLASRAQVGSAPKDTVDRIISSLSSKLREVDVFRDSMVTVLRVDSGTPRADSVVLRARIGLQTRIAAAASFNDAAFQAEIWPQNTAAGQRRLTEMGRGLFPPGSPAQVMTTDSVVRFLAAHGIRAHVEEGDAYMEAQERTVLDMFGRFVTPPMREYLRLRLVGQEHRCCADADVVISWDELGERVAAFDRLLAANPNLAAAAEASESYRLYLGLFLTGAENSPIFWSTTKAMQASDRAAFERYVKKYPALKSGRVVAEYLRLLAANGWMERPEVTRFLRANHGALVRGTARAPYLVLHRLSMQDYKKFLVRGFLNQ